MSLDDYRSEFDVWVGMWDELQKEYPEPESPKTVVPATEDDSVRDLYYGYLDESEPTVLSEEKKFVNPVYPDSVGPDNETTPPAWTNEDIVKKITELKDRLFKLENDFASQMGGGKKWKEKSEDSTKSKSLSKIEKLKKEIDKLSDSLGTEHEAKPWFDTEEKE